MPRPRVGSVARVGAVARAAAGAAGADREAYRQLTPISNNSKILETGVLEYWSYMSGRRQLRSSDE